jgi:hypothetical protein
MARSNLGKYEPRSPRLQIDWWGDLTCIVLTMDGYCARKALPAGGIAFPRTGAQEKLALMHDRDVPTIAELRLAD